MPKPAIIITPGPWHTPRHYARLITHLSNHNYSATAVALPSVNSSPPLPTWEQDALRQVITENLDLGHDVIAIAHSFGGVAMSEAVKGLSKEARQRQGFATGVLRLVYMCAMALPKGQTHVGQMKPVMPEEERERREKEYEEKQGGGAIHWGRSNRPPQRRRPRCLLQPLRSGGCRRGIESTRLIPSWTVNRARHVHGLPRDPQYVYCLRERQCIAAFDAGTDDCAG